MKRQVIKTTADLDRLEEQIVRSVDATSASLKQLLSANSSLGAFARLKFTEAGHDPLNVDRPLNFIEQLNQTFTYLASVEAARWLLTHHPECAPLALNLGTLAGFDIESECREFVAETFAVTHPGSNDKLRKDVAKMQTTVAAHRFVFYISPSKAGPFQASGVTIVQLQHPVIDALDSDA
jgi:hypothetical protein